MDPTPVSPTARHLHGRSLLVVLAVALTGAATPLLVHSTASLAVDTSETVSLTIGPGNACWIEVTPPGAADPGKAHGLAINTASPSLTWTDSGARQLDLCGSNSQRPATSAIVTAGKAGVYVVRGHL